MTIIRYVDIYKSEMTEEGMVDTIHLKDATLPIVLDPIRVETIQPYFNGNGKIFKNVSYINYQGELMKVVGNYKLLEKKLINNTTESRIEITGYKRYGNTE